MAFFPAELEIAPDEGFTPEKDIFGRKAFGEQLTRIVTAIETPGVLLLDAPWGTGKSTFIKMWRGELLKSSGIHSIYFDAFANDYQKDAFLAIASQIVADTESFKPQNAKAIKTFTTKAIQVVKVLGRASLRLGVKAASAGLVESEGLEKAGAEIVKAAGDETANLTDDLIKTRLESHDSDRKVFENFKAALAELATAFVESKNKDKTGEAKEKSALPLILIIDELDRCRPSFALEVLERIKHFFSVPNVVFLLVTSLAQLESAVHFAYGDIDARTYLEKFYQLRVLFPAGRVDRPDKLVETYLLHLKCHKYVSDFIHRSSEIKPLSLRTLERIAAYSKIVEVSIPPNGLFLPAIVAILCIMKVKEPSLYELTRKGQLTFAQVDQLFQFSNWRDPQDPQKRSHTGENAENWWRFALRELKDQAVIDRFNNAIWQYHLDDRNIIPYFCELMDGVALS